MFSTKTTLIALVLVLGSTSSGFASDDIADYSIRRALDSAAAEKKLDPRIRLSFGHRGRGAGFRHIGRWKAYKTSNSFAHSHEVACERAFIAAVVSLQRRAKAEGGNAVINIKSYYDNRESSSETTYVCGLGKVRSGVFLVGTVVDVRR